MLILSYLKMEMIVRADRKTGIIFFPAYDWAISPSHPEREERLLYTQDQLREEGVFDIDGITEYKPLVAEKEDILRTHFCFPSVEAVTTDSHLISAGGAIKAAQLVMEKEVERAFALVRPPGHHAMKSVHGNRGFCNINNEAVMIEYLRDHYGVKKIAIVDTDCHHGDGTQDIYWHDPNVLFISIHQDGRTLYPGSGHLDENGGPNATGRTINIPLPPETSDDGFLYVIENIVQPILDDFKPEIIINSAGQDNHYSDPITNMNFSALGYAKLNDMLNPHICVLEGGYSIQGALPYVNLGIVLAMAGVDYSYVKEPGFEYEIYQQTKKVTEYIKNLSDKVLKNYFEPDIIKKNCKVGEYIERRKFPYYDTDGIQENQNEKLLNCDNCSGLYLLESSSDIVSLSYGVEIPINACERCKKIGYEKYLQAKSSKKYNIVQLIDRVTKQYLS